VAKIYPIEIYVQRQQLKFLWKILHLEDTALQQIVLHGKLDPKYSQSRGGRQRTYKQCIKDAMANFGVTMLQCMTMAQKDWDSIIEGTGMETAAQQWEARPKASKPIDIEWRTKPGKTQGRRKDMNAEEDSDESSAPESASENEAVQSHLMHEGNQVVEVREDFTPWDDAGTEEDMDTRASAGYRLGARSHGNHVRMKAHNQNSIAVDHDTGDTMAARNDNHQIAEELMDATKAIVDHQRSEDRSGGTQGEKEVTQESARQDSHQIAEEPMDVAEAVIDQQRAEDLSGKRVTVDEMQDSGVAKRKAKKHRRRNNKRVREEVNTATIGRHEIQRELKLIVGDGSPTPTNASVVPWEHRGLLGQTDRRRDVGDHSDT
jgi:hypothetical protein